MRMSCRSRRVSPVFAGTPSPPSVELDVTTRLPRCVVELGPQSNSKPTAQHLVEDAERLQRAQRVRRLVDADAVDVRLGLDLDDLDLDAAIGERGARAEPADARADDEDLLDVGHGRPQCTLAAAQGLAASRFASSASSAGGNASIIESGIDDVAVEGVRALVGMPALRLPVGDVEAVAAGVDLDPHAAGLAEVEVVLLAHAVPAGAELDRDVGVEQDVGRAQELVARVDPPRDVVHAAGHAGLVEDEPEVVRLLVVRDHREHGDVGVGQDRVLGERGAERVAVPLGVADRVVAHHGDVVDHGAARCRAGRSAAGGRGTATPSRPAARSARPPRTARGPGRPAPR